VGPSFYLGKELFLSGKNSDSQTNSRWGRLSRNTAAGKFNPWLEKNRMRNQFSNITGGHRLPASNATGAAHAARNGMFPALKTMKQLFGGPRIFALAGLLIVAAVIAPAADTPEATLAYRPGDTVRVIVTFKEPISLKNAMLRFGLQGALPAGQKVFTSIFDANALVKLSDREFELTGKIGEHVATGSYQLGFISATDDADFTRNFSAGQDLPVITISVRNDRRVEFPDIQTVRVAPQPASKP
jgi:hypothetical protein